MFVIMHNKSSSKRVHKIKIQKMKVTIVICTYNGAKDLPGVLDHLHDQEGTDRIRWEVLVVENNSTPGRSLAPLYVQITMVTFIF